MQRTGFLVGALHVALFTAASQTTTSLQEHLKTTHRLIQTGNMPEALHQLSLLQAQFGDNPEARLAIGEIFQELGSMRAEELQQAAPDSAAAHELLGKAFEAKGQLDNALAEYEKVSAINPGEPGIHFLLGNLEWKLKNTDASVTQLKEELTLNPHHAMANLRLGQISLIADRDNPDKAIVFLQEATADANSSLEAHRELGKALRLAHRYPEAVEELKKVEEQRPQDDSVHAQLAALYRDMGDTKQAHREIGIHAQLLRDRLKSSQAANQSRR